MIVCHLRKVQVMATPEERVRQNCLNLMLHKLGYPSTCLLIEKSIEDLPHLQGKELPKINRRLDLLVYSLGKPLLLIECKRNTVNQKTIEQIMGYNYFVGAPFIALASPNVMRTAWFSSTWIWSDGLPSYESIAKSKWS